MQVGKVISISLKDYRARVGMRINDGVHIDTDAIASIKTSGIIGDKYVSVSLGGGDHDLADGGVIRRTQSAFVLEDAIGQLINGTGSSSPGGGNGSGGGAGGSGKSTSPGDSDKDLK